MKEPNLVCLFSLVPFPVNVVFVHRVLRVCCVFSMLYEPRKFWSGNPRTTQRLTPFWLFVVPVFANDLFLVPNLRV